MISLAGVAQLAGVPSVDRKLMGLIPGQGTFPGCGFNPRSGHIPESTSECVNKWDNKLMFLFLSLPSSLSKINK